MLFLLGAFFAGGLTVLAPCVLPLLPIIIGGSVSGSTQDKRRPLLITASLAVSLFIFTLLLKATTLLINIPPRSINFISGTIVILLGLFTLFPGIYANILGRLGVESKALKLLSKGTKQKNSIWGPLLIGAALGPVFSSCSPVYGYILATVLPVNFGAALSYIVAYIVGLASILLLIGFYGQKFISKIKWISDPKSSFSKVIALLFIIVGLLVFTGLDKRFQTFVSRNTPFNFDGISARLIPGETRETNDQVLNISEPYAAPEFVGLGPWINSSPKTISELKGKVVLVDFWTYSCINCIRNNPYIEQWYQKYKNSGFEVIGVHAPEFAFERLEANVAKAVKDQNINYPVALDNNFSTWAAYQNQYWPAAYLIDAEGNIRRTHFGEGEYNETEQAIRQLLEKKGEKLDDSMATNGGEAVPVSANQTPETYTGLARASNFTSLETLGSKPPAGFTFPASQSANSWALSGNWTVGEQSITSGQNAKLRFTISSKDTYLVAKSESPLTITAYLNGSPISDSASSGKDVVKNLITVDGARLYHIVANPEFTENYMLELEFSPGIEINAFTFGS